MLTDVVAVCRAPVRVPHVVLFLTTSSFDNDAATSVSHAVAARVIRWSVSSRLQQSLPTPRQFIETTHTGQVCSVWLLLRARALLVCRQAGLSQAGFRVPCELSNGSLSGSRTVCASCVVSARSGATGRRKPLECISVAGFHGSSYVTMPISGCRWALDVCRLALVVSCGVSARKQSATVLVLPVNAAKWVPHVRACSVSRVSCLDLRRRVRLGGFRIRRRTVPVSMFALCARMASPKQRMSRRGAVASDCSSLSMRRAS